MLAQALVEHAMLASLAESIQRTAVIVEDYIRGVDARIAMGALAVIVIGFLLRRR